MWLLDVNMDVNLVPFLRNQGLLCETSAQRGWGGLVDRELVSAAVRAGFACLLTRDRQFGQSAARALVEYPHFAVVVVRLPQRPRHRFLMEFSAQWFRSPIRPVPGHVVCWPLAP